MHARLLDPQSASWSAEIDRLGALLRAGENPTLFPYHFLHVVLPRLGGKIVWLEQESAPQGVGFLFPRRLKAMPIGNGQEALRTEQEYTLRYHSLHGPVDAHQVPQILREVAGLLSGASLVYHDPLAAHQYARTHYEIGNVSIGRPNADEAAATRALHQQIWGSPPEFLYPSDIFSSDFSAGTALVARVDNRLAGFLFGFSKFDGPPLPADWGERFRGGLRLESQVMGVLPDYRGMRIGNLLKRVQAEEALRNGIRVIHWTADPLQYPNAALNFGLLRALAFHHYPDLYPFRNDLNRVPASRFGLTWLVGTERVRNIPLTGSRSLVLDLARQPEIRRVNAGLEILDLDTDQAYIAVEIPADWTGLQQRSLELAHQWRAVSDRLLARYVGMEPGHYVITGVATEGERRFLIGQRVDDALWEHLGHVGE